MATAVTADRLTRDRRLSKAVSRRRTRQSQNRQVPSSGNTAAFPEPLAGAENSAGLQPDFPSKAQAPAVRPSHDSVAGSADGPA